MSAQLKGRLRRLHCTLAAFAMLVSAAMVSLTATPAQAVNADQFAWPATGHTDANDVAWHRSNENGARAVDIQALTGTPVYAAQSGVVVVASAGCANSNSWGCGHGFGNYVIIRHDRPSVANPLYTLYGHLNRDNLSVSVNQFVSTGTRLGEIALSGTTTGGHTHFAIGTCSTPWSSGPSDYDTNCTVWNGSDTADGTVTKGDPVPGTYAELNGVGGGSSPATDVAGYPTAITRSSTSMDVFYRSTSGHLVNKWWDASFGWATQSWTDSTVVGDPVAVARGVDDMDVFYRGTNGSLVNRGWNVGSGWGAPTVLASGGVAGVPAVVSRSVTSMDLFWRTDGGALRNMWWNASAGWSGVQTLASSGITGDPVAIARTSTSLDIFVRKGNGYLANLFWNPTSGWQYQDWNSGMSGGRPTAVSRYASSMDVFFRKSGSLGNRYWNPTSGWHYQEWPAGIANSPTAVARSSSNIDVFFRATNGDLVVRYWSASQGWGGPSIIASEASGLVTAVARGSDNMDLFFRTTAGGLKNAGWNTSQGWYHVTSL